jgi:hypothetical protein
LAAGQERRSSHADTIDQTHSLVRGTSSARARTSGVFQLRRISARRRRLLVYSKFMTPDSMASTSTTSHVVDF